LSIGHTQKTGKVAFVSLLLGLAGMLLPLSVILDAQTEAYLYGASAVQNATTFSVVRISTSSAARQEIHVYMPADTTHSALRWL
jgi:hypothetical protein